MKKDVYYFPHFCHSRSDNKMRRIMKDFKHEGYSVFYQVLEILREQEEFKYPLEDCDLLVDDLKTTDIILNSLIHNYGLFENDGIFFWSNDLIDSLQPFIKMKQQRIEAAKKSVEARKRKALLLNKKQTTVERPLNDRKTEVETPVEQSKVNESKVNESKVNESKVNESKVKERFSFLFSHSEFEESFNDFVEMRKSIKAVMTERAKELLLIKLCDLTNKDVHVSIEILNQSILNNWKGIFSLKNDSEKLNNYGKSNNGTGNKNDELVEALKNW